MTPVSWHVTALHMASANGHVSMCRTLVDAGAVSHLHQPLAGRTALAATDADWVGGVGSCHLWELTALPPVGCQRTE